jgi:hypothetical protein
MDPCPIYVAALLVVRAGTTPQLAAGYILREISRIARA